MLCQLTYPKNNNILRGFVELPIVHACSPTCDDSCGELLLVLISYHRCATFLGDTLNETHPQTARDGVDHSGIKPLDYLLHDNFLHDRVQLLLLLYGIVVAMLEQNLVHAYGWANSLEIGHGPTYCLLML